jgi:hypothetical protein
MSETISLKELERKAYRSFFKDGIWDIYLGLLLLAMGIGQPLLALGASLVWAAVVPLALVALAMFILLGGKRWLTVPRLGTVRFGHARKVGRKRAVVVFSASVLVGLALFALSWTGITRVAVLEVIPLPALVFAANCIVVFGLAGYFLDFSRLYAYAVLYAAAFPLAVLLHGPGQLPYGWMFAYSIASAPMLVIGLVLLVRFLREYPLTREPAMESNG